jgi:hypothetical protein
MSGECSEKFQCCRGAQVRGKKLPAVSLSGGKVGLVDFAAAWFAIVDNECSSRGAAKMSEKVVGLHGTWQPAPPPEPNESVVAELEELLEAARAGDLIGFAIACQHRDRVGWCYAGATGGFGILGAIECLKERLLRAMLRRGG